MNEKQNTGPRTPEGKEISSRNATRHGCCATETLLVGSETMPDFTALENTWLNVYSPHDEAETDLVHQLVMAEWLLRRSTRTVLEIEARLFATSSNPLDWPEAQQKTLTRFQRYRTSYQNAAAKYRKSIEDYRKNRATEIQKSEKHEIVKERFKVFARKNKPKPTWDETLASMRAEAIRLGYAEPDPPPQPKP